MIQSGGNPAFCTFFQKKNRLKMRTFLKEVQNLDLSVIAGILLPLIGTSLGAACVFFINGNKTKPVCNKKLTAFAAGVMTAASVWSLLIPATERSASLGKFSFVPAVIGFWLGVFLLIGLDYFVSKISANGIGTEKPGKTAMLVFAVAMHNIPEGMAVGAVYAGLLSGSTDISAAGAFALSLGIAIQNLPEGAIISLPVNAAGYKKSASFICGVISGIAEPLAAVFTVAAAGIIVPVLPYLLAFAAGTMIYVVIDELINETSVNECAAFCVGFTLMMALDVALGG